MAEATVSKPGQNVRYSGFGVILLGCALFGAGAKMPAIALALAGLAAIVVGFAMDRSQPIWLRLFGIVGTLVGAPVLYMRIASR